MSLSWSDTRIGLLPGRAAISAGRKPPAVAEAGTGWDGALAALEDLLTRQARGGVNVTLSHHFLRLFLLDPPPTWLRRAEMDAWLSERLADTLGDVGVWQRVWSDVPPGRPVPVCAILAERLDELQMLLSRHGSRAHHIRPWLDVLWPRRYRQLARGTGWYALLEPGMASLLRVVHGRIDGLRQRQLGDDVAGELSGMLHREALLAGVSPEGELWLERTGPLPDLQTLGPGWRVHEFAGPTDPGLALLV